MNKEDRLIDAIGEIDDEYIKDAHIKKRKSNSLVWPKRIALAFTCLLVIFVYLNVALPVSYDSANSKAEDSNSGAFYDNDEGALATDSDGIETDQEKKVIVSGNLSLETLDLDETVNVLTNNINESGGYIQSSSTYSNGSRRYYYATIRIPADKYNDFINTIKGSGNTVSYSEEIDDITTSYYDLDAHIKALKAQEERVLELYKQANTLEEILQIEERLSDIRYEIEQEETTMKNYDLLTSYSTLEITISETREYTPTQISFGSRIVESFKNGWTNFISLLEEFVITFVYNIWTILLLILIIFIGYKIFKTIKARKK